MSNWSVVMLSALLGGGGLVGAISSGPGPVVRPPAQKYCGDMEVDPAVGRVSYTEKKGHFWLHRVVGWDSIPLSKGKWVGAIQRDPSDTDTDSHLFGLNPGEWGCLRFKVDKKAGGGLSSVAHLYHNSGGPRDSVYNSLVCHHDSAHPPRVSPMVLEDANACSGPGTSLYATVATSSGALASFKINTSQKQWVHNLGSAIEPLTEMDTQTLKANQGAELNKVVADLEKAGRGPWFPCTSTECCRAF